ncbi:MAG TPA: hypothetical protein VFN68_09390 [Acidimicrobiales bacterium]|nr:hypothetical protein [Acidimicrobiales bacterium]
MTRPGRRELVAGLVQTAVLSGAAVTLAGVFGRSITVWSTIGVAAVVVVAGHVQRHLEQRTEMQPSQWADDRFERPLVRLAELRQQVQWGLESPERFGQVLQPTLASLADDRLRRRHGVERGADPEQARELMGDDLWKVVAEPVTTVPTLRRLAQLVERIEQL